MKQKQFIGKIMLFLCLLLSAFSAKADLFTVEKVHVDVTDKNATIAREQALNQAQQEAFSLLLDSLLLPQDKAQVEKTELTEVLNLVQDFSVANEKTSSFRYLADISVHFNAKKVQNFLQERAIPYLSTQAQRQLVLPIYTSFKKTRLWEDNNPWKKVWQGQTTVPVPLVVPEGTEEEALIYSSKTLMNEETTDLTPFFKQYEASDALVVEAVYYSDNAQIKVTVRPFKNEKNAFGTFSFMLPVKDNQVTDTLKQARDQVKETLVLKWKEKNVLRADAPDFLTAVVPFSGLPEWIKMQKRLKEIQLIKKYEVKAVRRDQAQIELYFLGELSDFLEKLKDNGLFLALTQGDIWSLCDLASVSPEEINALVIPEERKAIQFPIVNMESWQAVAGFEERAASSQLQEIPVQEPALQDDSFQEGFLNRAVLWENE